jgi:hypothetical protein
MRRVTRLVRLRSHGLGTIWGLILAGLCDYVAVTATTRWEQGYALAVVLWVGMVLGVRFERRYQAREGHRS